MIICLVTVALYVSLRVKCLLFLSDLKGTRKNIDKLLRKQTNKMHFLYVFILQFMYNSTCFERPFRSSSGFHDLLYLQLSSNRKTEDTFQHGLYRAADTVNHELLMKNEMVVRNM